MKSAPASLATASDSSWTGFPSMRRSLVLGWDMRGGAVENAGAFLAQEARADGFAAARGTRHEMALDETGEYLEVGSDIEAIDESFCPAGGDADPDERGTRRGSRG